MRGDTFSNAFIFTVWVSFDLYSSMKSKMEGWCSFADEKSEAHPVSLSDVDRQSMRMRSREET